MGVTFFLSISRIMLEFTGNINGEYVEQKLVSAKDLIKNFKLDLPKSGLLRFELHPSQLAINKADGTEKFAYRRLLLPETEGVSDGERCLIRYYTRKRPGPTPGRYIYFPNRIPQQGKEWTVDVAKDLEIAVLLLLNSKCADSPFHIPGRSVAEYKISDSRKKAQADMAQVEQYQELIERVKTAPDGYIIRVAKGVALREGLIKMEDANDPFVARAELYNMAKTHPERLANALESKDVQIAGLVSDAAATGKIVYRTSQGGVINWMYADQFGGGQICDCPPKTNIQEILIEHLMNPNNLSRFMGKLYPDTQKGEKVEGGEVKSEVLTPQQIAEKAIEEGILVFDPTDNKVYVMEGKFRSERAFMVVKDDPEKWREELYERMSDTKAAQLNKYFEQ